jgi:cyclophilin family peptidyl-prolyl cis-trans isomerase
VNGSSRLGAFGTVAMALAVVGCATALPDPLRVPASALSTAAAPDSFVAEVVTSEGAFEITMIREWSPVAVDRVYFLMANNFYAGARFYRVEPGFVVQWGFSGDPSLDSLWHTSGVEDEPVVGSNLRGTVSFARGGPETRSIQLFVNLADNVRLDSFGSGGVVGYPAIGRIDVGLEVVDGFYPAYRPSPPRQDSISALGNDYLQRHFPQLDSVVSTRVTRWWN